MSRLAPLTLALVCLLVSSCLAEIFVTNPIQTTTVRGGQTLTVRWRDDGTTPSADDFGPSSVGLYTGNRLQQTLLQPFGNVNPSNENSVTATINPEVGPNGSFYFIRFQSLARTDAAGNPLLAFSSLFTLAGMTGQLDPAVLAQVSGITTPLAQLPTAPASLVTRTSSSGSVSAASSTTTTTLRSGNATTIARLSTTTSASNSTRSTQSSAAVSNDISLRQLAVILAMTFALVVVA